MPPASSHRHNASTGSSPSTGLPRLAKSQDSPTGLPRAGSPRTRAVSSPSSDAARKSTSSPSSRLAQYSATRNSPSPTALRAVGAVDSPERGRRQTLQTTRKNSQAMLFDVVDTSNNNTNTSNPQNASPTKAAAGSRRPRSLIMEEQRAQSSSSASNNRPSGRPAHQASRSESYSSADKPPTQFPVSEEPQHEEQEVLAPQQPSQPADTSTAEEPEIVSAADAQERDLRAALLRRMVASFGPKVLEGVDEHQIIRMGDEAVQHVPIVSDSRNASQSSLQISSTGGIGLQRSASASGSIAGGKGQANKNPLSNSTNSQDSTKKKRNLFGFRKKEKKQGDSFGSSVDGTLPAAAPPTQAQVPVFGLRLNQLPKNASCMTVIGGQSHILPIIMFSVVEEMYRRGLNTPALFRMLGDYRRIDSLADEYNTPPLYGDKTNLEVEAIETVSGLFKRYLRELPDPVFDSRLWPLFMNSCMRPSVPENLRIGAAQTILRLVPRRNFSLFVYLIAFLCQLSQHQANGLSNQDIAYILGPSVLAPRAKPPHRGASPINRRIHENINTEAIDEARKALHWILDYWPEICGAPAAMAPAPPASSPATFQVESPHPSSISPEQQPKGLSPAQHPKALSPGQPLVAAAPTNEDDEVDHDTSYQQANSSRSRTPLPPLDEDGEPEVDPTEADQLSRRYIQSDPAQQQPIPPPVDIKTVYSNIPRRSSPMPDLSSLENMSNFSESLETPGEPHNTFDSDELPKQYSRQPALNRTQSEEPNQSFVSAQEALSPAETTQDLGDHQRHPSPFGGESLRASVPEDKSPSPIPSWHERPESRGVLVSHDEEPDHPSRSIHSRASIEQMPGDHAHDDNDTPVPEEQVEVLHPKESSDASPDDDSSPKSSQDTSVHNGDRDSKPSYQTLLATMEHHSNSLSKQSSGQWFGQQPTQPRATTSQHHHQQQQQQQQQQQSELDRLKAENADLVQRMARQQSHFSSERDMMSRAVRSLETEMADLRQVVKAKVQKEESNNELVREWKRVSERAELQASEARESGGRELERLIRLVRDVTKERDAAHRRLRQVRKALSSEEFDVGRSSGGTKDVLRSPASSVNEPY